MNARRWFLYLIECRDGSVYTGITVDVEARYAAHVSGKGARYTSSHPPARVLVVLDYPDRSRASQAEYEVKTLSAVEKRAYALTLVLAAAAPTNPLNTKKVLLTQRRKGRGGTQRKIS